MASLSDYFNNATFNLFKPKPVGAQEVAGATPAIGANPTPTPGDQYSPSAYQSTGGQIYTGTPNPYTSQGGLSYGSGGQIVSTQFNPTITNTNTDPSRLSSGSTTTSSSGGGALQSVPNSSGSSADLINALMNGGYNYQDALNAANGPNRDKLAQEYLGGGSNPPSFKLKNTSELLTNVGVGNNTPISTDMEQYFTDLKNAAAAGDQAAIDQLNAVYGQQQSTLQGQYEQASTDQAAAEKELGLQLKQAQDTYATQKSDVGKSVATSSEQAAEAARSAQRQNRNIMRALGILGSTYAAEALQNPMNELAKQKAGFVQWGMDQVSKLDQSLNQFTEKLTLAKDDLLGKYATIKANIQNDMRYTEQQKAASLQALKAGAQQNLAAIEGQRISYAQQLEQQKTGFATQIAQILLNQNPGADISAIMSKAMQTTGQVFPASQQVATVAASPSRQTLSGFNMNNYIGWDPNVAYQDWKKKQGL